MKKLLFLFIVLLLSACESSSSKIEGTYVSDANKEVFTFNSNRTVSESSAGGVKVGDFPYTVEGDKIKIGPVFSFTRLKDGSLDAGLMFGRLIKK